MGELVPLQGFVVGVSSLPVPGFTPRADGTLAVTASPVSHVTLIPVGPVLTFLDDEAVKED